MARALEQVAQRVGLEERDACCKERARHLEAVCLVLERDRGTDHIGAVLKELAEAGDDALVAQLAPLQLLSVLLVLGSLQMLVD